MIKDILIRLDLVVSEFSLQLNLNITLHVLLLLVIVFEGRCIHYSQILKAITVLNKTSFNTSIKLLCFFQYLTTTRQVVHLLFSFCSIVEKEIKGLYSLKGTTYLYDFCLLYKPYNESQNTCVLNQVN